MHVATPPKFSALGFGTENSNLYADDLSSVIKAIGFRDPWPLMDNICATVGISTSGVKDDLTNFLRRRNQAAHNANARFDPSDVDQSARAAFATALCFDVIFSYCVATAKKVGSWSSTLLILRNPRFDFRFLDEGQDGRWRERTSVSARVYRTYQLEQDARRDAGSRARARSQVLILRDPTQQPRDWLILT